MNAPVATVMSAVLPLPDTSAPAPMNASVVLSMTLTAPAAPTPASPETASTPTMASISVWSSALIHTLPPASTLVAPNRLSAAVVGSSPMNARVRSLNTWTEASSAIDALPLAPRPAATEVMSSLATAPTVTSPSVVTVAPL